MYCLNLTFLLVSNSPSHKINLIFVHNVYLKYTCKFHFFPWFDVKKIKSYWLAWYDHIKSTTSMVKISKNNMNLYCVSRIIVLKFRRNSTLVIWHMAWSFFVVNNMRWVVIIRFFLFWWTCWLSLFKLWFYNCATVFKNLKSQYR